MEAVHIAETEKFKVLLTNFVTILLTQHVLLAYVQTQIRRPKNADFAEMG